MSLMAAVYADIRVSVGDKKAPKSWRVSRVSSQLPEVKDVSDSKYARGLHMRPADVMLATFSVTVSVLFVDFLFSDFIYTY